MNDDEKDDKVDNDMMMGKIKEMTMPIMMKMMIYNMTNSNLLYYI